MDPSKLCFVRVPGASIVGSGEVTRMCNSGPVFIGWREDRFGRFVDRANFLSRLGAEGELGRRNDSVMENIYSCLMVWEL